MLARVANPLPLVPVAVSVLLAATGVAGFVLGRRALRSGRNEDLPFTAAEAAVIFGGGAQTGSPNDDPTMRGNPYGYTSFFTQSVEQAVIGMLQGWKNTNGTSDCKMVYKNVPQYGGIAQVPAYISASARAAASVLDTLWPSGRPWAADEMWKYAAEAKKAEEQGVSLWRAWLWWRVVTLADKHVCNFVPVT